MTIDEQRKQMLDDAAKQGFVVGVGVKYSLYINMVIQRLVAWIPGDTQPYRSSPLVITECRKGLPFVYCVGADDEIPISQCRLEKPVIIGQDNTKLLEGRQLVVDGTMQAGDVLVFPSGETQVLRDNDLKKVYERGGTVRVYRKMPVASHLDREPTCPPPEVGPHTPLDVAQLPFAKAKTYDDGKPPLAWLPWKALDEVALVQLYGHAKYKDFNNYRKGMEVSRNLSCAIRHIRAYMNGETNDPESHRNHLAHAACRLLFTLENIADNTAIDDRHKQQTQ